MSNRCVHGTYVGDWAGPDYICGSCEEGLCVHGNHVSGFAWEDTEGCDRCGIAPRLRTVASFEESSRIAQLCSFVRFNPRTSIHRLAFPHRMSAKDLVVMVEERYRIEAERAA